MRQPSAMPWPSSAVNSGPRRLSPPPRITKTYRNSQPTCSTAFWSSPADRPDLQSQVEGIAQFAARIAAIGEDVAQPGKPVADGLEQGRGSVSILHIGRMNQDEEHQSECVSDDVALAALDLFPGVVARYPSAFGRLHALAIDDARCGTGLAAFQFTRTHDQEMVDGLPQTAVTPIVEVALHRGPRRKIRGEHPPLAPAGRDEQNGIHDRAQIDRARPSARACRRQKRRNDRPFPIRHVARIASATTPMILASDVIPGHSILRLLTQRRRITTCRYRSTPFQPGTKQACTARPTDAAGGAQVSRRRTSKAFV